MRTSVAILLEDVPKAISHHQTGKDRQVVARETQVRHNSLSFVFWDKKQVQL